jgi:redox-sensitive bicupin YhaK (pirin superfamily)
MEIIRSNEKGFFDHGWLKTYHTFSFADYYNPKRMHFGMLRVVNDDIVEGNQGFGKHPHNDMEIISIPLYGSLAHKDSTGGEGVIATGEVQVMSAGTGVFHSERNPDTEAANFLQIWIFPKEKNVPPRYGQKKFDDNGWTDQFQLLVSPDGRNESLWIHQDAYLSRIKSSHNKAFVYEQYVKMNGVFLFVLEGKAGINSHILNRRDTFLAQPDESLEIVPEPDSQLLFIEVPMV